MNTLACIYVSGVGSENVCVCVCVSNLSIAASRVPLSADLFSANESDLYGEVSGLNIARCVCFLKVFFFRMPRKVSDCFLENFQPFVFSFFS
jgi:hypothetical protein